MCCTRQHFATKNFAGALLVSNTHCRCNYRLLFQRVSQWVNNSSISESMLTSRISGDKILYVNYQKLPGKAYFIRIL